MVVWVFSACRVLNLRAGARLPDLGVVILISAFRLKRAANWISLPTLKRPILPFNRSADIGLVDLEDADEMFGAEALAVDVVEQRPPDIGFDLEVERLGRREAEIVEDVTFGDVAGPIWRRWIPGLEFSWLFLRPHALGALS